MIYNLVSNTQNIFLISFENLYKKKEIRMFSIRASKKQILRPMICSKNNVNSAKNLTKTVVLEVNSVLPSDDHAQELSKTLTELNVKDSDRKKKAIKKKISIEPKVVKNVSKFKPARAKKKLISYYFYSHLFYNKLRAFPSVSTYAKILKKIKMFRFVRNLKTDNISLNYTKVKNVNFFYLAKSIKGFSETKFLEKSLIKQIKGRFFPLKRFTSPVKKLTLKYSQVCVTTFMFQRFVNICIGKGLKSKMESFVNKCLKNFKVYFKQSKNPSLFFQRFLILFFLQNVPKLTIKGVRRGSVVYKVPFLMVPYQQYSILLKWFKDSVYERSENQYFLRLFNEMFELLDKSLYTQTIKKKTSLSKLVAEGRAFAHYRWV